MMLMNEHQDVEFNFLPRQRARKYTNRPEILEDPEDSSSSEYTTEEDIYSDTVSIGSESDNDPISGISEIFEDIHHLVMNHFKTHHI
ncbi:hypothetical protein RIR_jg26634.t1 [Rhizophagus irregularis DAOM 181602=DAOM 197198]|nr:hypothetical protein RIR_jg26634.t1 [Rhizophagus irregularis DAOM 181602=DAOM 197198]